MGTGPARSIAEAAAGVLSSRDAGARSIVAAAVADVVHGRGSAQIAFDAYLADPTGGASRRSFVDALADVLSTDAAALARVETAVEAARGHPPTGEHATHLPLPEASPHFEDWDPPAPVPSPPSYRPSPHADGAPPSPGGSGGGGLLERLGRAVRRINPFGSGEEATAGPQLESVTANADGAEAGGQDEAAAVGAESATIGEASPDAPAAPYRAYPYIRPTDHVPGQDYLIQPEVPFSLDIGTSRSAPVEAAVIATPAGLGEVRAGLTVHVQLSYDPASLSIDGPTPIVLQLTADDPYPRQTVTVTPLATAKPLSNRRIAAHYIVDGKVRAIAFRTFRDADAPPAPKSGSAGLVDLTPLADEEAPDLVLAIYGADAASPGTFTMAAFPRDADVAPPELGRIDLGLDSPGFMKQMFKEGNRGGDPTGVYDALAGIAWRIGSKIPDPILRTLKAVAEAPHRERAATMLLLTEESAVPWELAALGGARDITSTAGGSSPFLGAHFAIGRWPIAESVASSPVPDPRPIDVRKTALVRADYDGVGDGWRPLPGAVSEVAALARDYSPADEWSPVIDDVKDNLLFSDVDVIHFALHGQVDDAPGQSGLVLLRKDGDKVRPAYLSADAILSLLTRDPGPPLPRHPFVFLNACQVGQGNELLGDYAGLAAALIAAGARAVVACIWNVNDGVAGSISREFYRRTDAGETPAEILRSVRTRYVRPAPGAAASDDPANASVPTLIAYQYFGHPGMRVVRAH